MIRSLEVRKKLLSLQDKQANTPSQYVVLGGNSGDTLIDMGFFALAEDVGFGYEVTSLSNVDFSRPIILSGGGGLVEEWSAEGTRRTIKLLHEQASELIILPQTVRGNQDLLAELGPNVTLFVREHASWNHVEEYCTGGANITLDHDMAFNLDARALLDEGRVKPPSPRSVKDSLRVGLYNLARARSALFNRIDVRRRDVERAPGQSRPVIPVNDLSFVATFRGKSPETIRNTAKLLLQLIDGYESVRSDRLHVGIGAFLLGKELVCVDNSNSKVRGVYEFSMSGSANVRMASD